MAQRVMTLKEAVSPLLWLNCIFCMGIFEIPTNHPQNILTAVYIVTLTVGYFVVLYMGIIIFPQVVKENLTLFYCVASINIIVAGSSMFLYWCKAKRLHLLLKRFSNADDTFEALGVKKNYKKLFYDVLLLLALYILCMSLLNVAHIVWMWRDVDYLFNFHIAVCFGVPIMMNSVVDVTFSSLIRCLQLKFKNINQLLENMVTSANESSCFKVQKQRKVTPLRTISSNCRNNKDAIKHFIQTLRQLHLEITRLAHGVNNGFCLQLLLEMAVHFSIVTSVSYLLFCAFVGRSNYSTRIDKIACMMTWAIVYSLKIILLNDICTVTSNEAHKTGEIVQSFEGSFLDNELREEIAQFTQQIVLNSVNLTAAGFFKINNVFTGKFFSTVTTYVVILIQMNTPTT